MVNLKLFGEVNVKVNNIDLTTQLPRKGFGLLIYMATQPTKVFYREQLANLLWHDYTKKSALNNLRFNLWQIRKIIGELMNEELIINNSKQAIKINSEAITSDYAQFYSASYSQQYHESVRCYSGDFLEDFYIIDAPDFSDWVFRERENAQRKYFSAQFAHAQDLMNSHRIEEAFNALTKLSDIDPLNEMVYLRLMQYQYASDNKVAAISTYRNLKIILRNELNISPSNEIESLYKRIVEDTNSKNSEVILHKSKGDQFFSQKIKIYISKSSEKLSTYARMLASYNNTGTQLVIDLCDTPGQRIPSEGMFEILNSLYHSGKYCISQWKSKCEKIDSDIRNKIIKDDMIFFSMFETLIVSEKSECLIIRIWNFQYLDSKTIEFLSYLSRRKLDKQIVILAVYDSSQRNLQVEKFIEFYQGINDVEVIEE